jgi:acetolactate synthase small subunit
MLASETEIERLARAMIVRHGPDAAKQAVARLNKMIDRHDWYGRDRWACVVRAIHASISVGPVFAETVRRIDAAPRFAHVA